MASDDYTDEEAEAARDWERRLTLEESRHLHVLDCMTVEAREDAAKLTALHERIKALESALAEALAVCEHYTDEPPDSMDQDIPGAAAQKIRALLTPTPKDGTP